MSNTNNDKAPGFIESLFLIIGEFFGKSVKAAKKGYETGRDK